MDGSKGSTNSTLNDVLGKILTGKENQSFQECSFLYTWLTTNKPANTPLHIHIATTTH